MSTLNPPKTLSKRQELRQDRVMTGYARAWEYFHENRKVVYGVAAAIVVFALAVVGYFLLQNQREATAQELLGSILATYEDEDFRAALDGSDTQAGLLEIADEYGGTNAGNLAKFYAADALYQLGQHDEALRWFRDFDAEANLVGASAVAGEAAVYMAQGEFERAGDRYREAAGLFESDITTPEYLKNAGLAYEEAGAYAEAVEVYEQIEAEYPESTAGSSVAFYLARARANMQQ